LAHARHSFTTRNLALGKTDDWVRTCTGHTSNEALRYRETARSLEELELGDVAARVDAIPELAALHRALSVGPANHVTALENDLGRWRVGQQVGQASRERSRPLQKSLILVVEPWGIEPQTS
jgi:hypothetical protein